MKRSGGCTITSGTGAHRAAARSSRARRTAAATWWRPSGTQTVTRRARVAAARSCAPSSTRCGERMRRSLSLSLAGSPSMALTTMVPPGPPPWAAASLMAAGNPAPPRPPRPDASNRADECVAPAPARAGRQRGGAQGGDVGRQVGGMAQQPVPVRVRGGAGEDLAGVRHVTIPSGAARVKARCLGGTASSDAWAVLIEACRALSRSLQARATPTASTHAAPSAMTQLSPASVPMPNVWASATGQLR